MILGGDLFHLQHKGVLPIHLWWEDLFLFNSTLSDDFLEQLLELAAGNGAILVIITYFEDIVYSACADVYADLPEGSFHLWFWDGIGAVHVDDLESFADADVCLLDSLKETIEGFFVFVAGKDSTSSQLSQELLVSDWLTSIKIELSKQQVELTIGDIEAQGLDGTEELILAQLSTSILIELLEVSDHGDVVIVDELDQLSKHVLEGLVIDINWLKPILDDL